MRDLAIRNTHPTVTTINGEVEAWDAGGNLVTLDETLIQAEVQRLQAEYDANQYQRDRAAEYDPIADQLDKLWHAIDQGLVSLKQSDFYLDNKAVKTKYPKGV